MTIHLTDDQRQVLQAGHGHPIDVIDPATQRRYVLLAREQYERIRPLLEEGTEDPQPGPALDIPPGILRSQQAFWRDLPELLKDKKNQGKWVCYHGEERLGIATSAAPLLRECLRRGLRDDEYDLDVIEPRDIAPW